MTASAQPDDEARFIARVAWACHQQGLTQAEAARLLGTTRPRVNRALADARRQGVVRISFDTPFAACFELEQRLCSAFGLRRALVAPVAGTPTDARPVISAALGAVLNEVLANRKVRRFGMAWGSTLHAAIRSVVSMRRTELEIISVMGGLTRGSDLNSFEITSQLARTVGAQHSFFTAPLYAGSAHTRDVIMELDVFRAVLDKLRRVDAIAMTAGDMSRRSLLIRDGVLTPVVIDELVALGAVGDVLGNFLDESGTPVDHPVNQRVIGIGLDDLAAIPNVILAAGGAHKVAIITAMLARGSIDTFVTDERTARALLRTREPA